MRIVICRLCLLVLGLTACKKATEQKNSADSSHGPETKVEACSLITQEEVAAVQAAPITNATASDVPEKNFATSQCYYGSSEADKSVSIGLTQGNRKRSSSQSLRDFWHEKFDRLAEGAKDADQDEAREKNESSREREEESKSHPTKIEGLGDEAFWAENRFGGILYVLKKDFMLRVSVGGPDDRETKLEKSKTLAQKALSRL